MPSRGAFMDQNGVRWDTNNADYEGVMAKKSKWMGEWRKRYLILKGTKLFFSKDSTSAPHGIIDLVDCVSVKSAEKKAQKKNAIEIELRNETFILVANNDKEKDTWISKVSQAIQEYNSVYVPPPPPPAGNNASAQGASAGLAHKRNHSSGSVGSRSNSSSNVTSESGEQATVASSVPEEDGEEGLLTFDDMPNMS